MFRENKGRKAARIALAGRLAAALLPLVRLTAAGAGLPEGPTLDFSHYDATGGFPQVMVSALLQDTKDNIWICSNREGKVARFDGSRTDHFNVQDPEALFTDAKGRVVVSSPRQGRVLIVDGDDTLSLRAGKDISFAPQFFLNLPAGRLLCASGTKIEVLESSVLPSSTLFSTNCGRSIKSCSMLSGLVLLGTVDGHLLRFDALNGTIDELTIFPSTVNAILPDERGGMWVGTRRDGLFHCNSSGEVISRIPLSGKNSDSGKENVLCLQYQRPGLLWIGTVDGLAILDEADGSIKLQRHAPSRANSLSHNTVRRILRDRQGGMWLGTYYGGTNYWHPSRNRFFAIRCGDSQRDLNDHIVNAIREDGRGLIWIGTNSGGINCYDPSTGAIRKYADPQGFNDIISLYPVPGTRQIIYYCNIGGLSRLDAVSGKVTRLCDSQYANMLLPVEGGKKLLLWSISGCCSLYDIASNSCSPAPDSLALPSSPLPQYAVAERDQFGCVWKGTPSGLERKTIGGQSRTFHSFDGLASEFFSLNAHCRSKDGRMYFGGIGGVTVFDPGSFEQEEIRPSPRISSVVLNGVTPIPVREDHTLKLRQTKGHYFFHFSIPDFISGGKDCFSYIMEGYDSGWIDAGADNCAVYTNLPRGSYILRLSASRDGEPARTDEVCAMKLKVIPPWYRSALALTLGLILLALMGFLAVCQIIHQKEMQNKLAMHELEARHEREISKLKALRFINATAGGQTVGKVKDLSLEEEQFITKALAIVEANISDTAFNSTTMAQKMNVSRMTLHKQMREMTGYSTLDFIHKVRFSEACRMLKETDLTVSEIAYNLGFGHPTSFVASFKKYMGCTPLEFKHSK